MDAFEGRTVRSHPPLLGEHSKTVLESFGLGEDEISRLVDTGVVGVAEGETA